VSDTCGISVTTAIIIDYFTSYSVSKPRRHSKTLDTYGISITTAVTTISITACSIGCSTGYFTGYFTGCFLGCGAAFLTGSNIGGIPS
jgi:hypothetical protein